MTLPSAPPSTSARPRQKSRFPGSFTINQLTTSAATSAKPTSSGVCQPSAPARKLNAAPRLKTSTRLKNPVTARLSPGVKWPSTTHFTSWSATMIAAANANHLNVAAFLTRPFQVALAAAAQTFGAHIGAVVPAALAFWMLTRRDCRRRLLRRQNTGGRGDERVLELVAQARERVVVGTVGAELHLGLQRRADLARGAQRLDLLAHRVAQLAQARPLGDQRGRVGGRGQLVQHLEGHAVVRAAGEQLPGFLRRERQDGRHQAQPALRDVPQRGLRRAPRRRVGAAGIETVLEEVEVERAQDFRTEGLQAMRDQLALVDAVLC